VFIFAGAALDKVFGIAIRAGFGKFRCSDAGIVLLLKFRDISIWR
jgi:hypothetical protein